ncbi:hypothetical protein I5U56_06520 [Stenotrophomonas maltophilia]|nr:hypothetical protein [Stenotrophomonas maltophilia]MBH1600342.1 hypothetical protein [Stenotrophomonas maltophilia]
MAKKATTPARNQRNEIRYQNHYWRIHAEYALEVFGDSLKKSQGWKNDLTGLDAVHYYLVQKHHWLPSVVRAMSLEDLRFALTEEMHGWKLPKDAGGQEGK